MGTGTGLGKDWWERRGLPRYLYAIVSFTVDRRSLGDECRPHAHESNIAAITLYIACVRTMSTRMLDLKGALPPRR